MAFQAASRAVGTPIMVAIVVTRSLTEIPSAGFAVVAIAAVVDANASVYWSLVEM
ncbi:hypothetical protein D3C78_1767900 [compost metagenome]